MILRISEVSTVDGVSTHTNTTFSIVSSALLAPTSNTDIIPQKLISIPADEILNAEDSEDYIEESVELYDELINNKSGEHQKLMTINISAQLNKPTFSSLKPQENQFSLCLFFLIFPQSFVGS